MFTTEQVQAATGKGWAEWIAILDASSTDKKSFVTMSNYLMRDYALRRLWAQVIAVYYNWGRVAVR
jgi:hypothetical protein